MEMRQPGIEVRALAAASKPAVQPPASTERLALIVQPAYELIFALAAIATITAGYVYLAQSGVPQANSLVGYCLGIVGFLMMLSTEIMYSLRKRIERFHFGQMSRWLQAHIFTGLVGPYLVLLHSGWKFNGLAGVLMLLTAVVVLSGLIGRYIYTSVPRRLDGVELAVVELEEQIATVEQQLQVRGIARLGPAAQALAADVPPRGWLLVLGRPFFRWRQKRRFRRALRQLGALGRAEASQLEKLLDERQQMLMQIHSLDATRRLLALWHMFHVPLGGALFTLVFIHIAAALYYATFLK